MKEEIVIPICFAVVVLFVMGFLVAGVVGIEREKSFQKCLEVAATRLDMQCVRSQQ